MTNPSVALYAENIPQVLKSQKRWAVYKLEPRPESPGKYGKAPRDAHMRRMDWKDHDRHMTFEEALTVYRGRHDCDGLGIFLGTYEGKKLWGFDMDQQVVDGFISPRAQEILDTLDTYTEHSPSGTGLHCLFYDDGSKPVGDRCKSQDGLLELYDGDRSARFFTITGNIADGCKNYITTASPKAAYEFIDPSTKGTTEATPPPSVAKIGTCSKTTEDVEAELSWLFPKVAMPLWNGDISGANNDHSAADAKLLYFLAGICEGDAVLMDKVFRLSGLYRNPGRAEKWDRPTGGQTYGSLTINKVISGDGSVIKPFDFEAYESMVRDRVADARKEGFGASVPKSLQYVIGDPTEPQENHSVVFESLTDYMECGGFDLDITEFAQYADNLTGWSGFDKKIGGLHPGLYLVGAAPGSGKTTWCWQLAQTQAAAGNPVFFYTLEQSRLDLVSKALSRYVFIDNYSQKGDGAERPTSREIRMGWNGTGYDKAREDFSKAAENLYIFEGSLELNVEKVRKHVEKFVSETGKHPYVFLDYLQLMTSADPHINRDKRLCMDHVVKVLKNIQRDYKLIMFVVSAYSRGGYRSPTKLDSFRESSGLEYTCDVALGLDYRVVHDSQKTGDELEAKIAEERKRYPARLYVTCVKNRFGETFKSEIDYYMASDCFIDPNDGVSVTKRSGGCANPSDLLPKRPRR